MRAQILSFEDEGLWAKLDEADMGPVDPSADCIPEYFQVGDEYQVASATGVYAATLTGFEVDVRPFEGDSILMLVFTPHHPLDEGGLVVRADGPRLTPLRPMDKQDDLSANYLEAYRDLTDRLSYEDDDLETRRPEVIPARFPPPYEVLVNATWTVRNPSIFGEIGAGLLLGHQGQLMDFPKEALRTSQYYRQYSLIDIGDDGIDDFLVEYCDNYETSLTMLVLHVWQGDQLIEAYLHEGWVPRPSWGGQP
ncbi:hypothetical protein ENSA5_64540 [Enhygromyxa salina]|uniref:Uncharacterized protein n=1 Tax=Enhygromyxa salina TaxID=215803 RepID=A0A2S9XCB2_9BACT|nr:hypothetical protein ENSA5_64540 [Enhygromyxa salina]